MNFIVNNNPKVSRITSMSFLNAHDLTLLLTGTGKNQNFFVFVFVCFVVVVVVVVSFYV